MTLDGATLFCAVGELAEGQVRSRRVGDLPVAVARHQGRLYAFGALCPHAQADLADGLLNEDGLACGRHLWNFDLATGQCTSMPGVSIPTYLVEERNGQILVRLPEA